MNRFVLFGVAAFFAIVGLALLGADNKVVAGHGCHGCNGGGLCDGGACHGGHGHHRCHGGGLFHRNRCHGRQRCHGGGLFHRHRCHGGHGCHGASDCCGVVVDQCGCHGSAVQKGYDKGYEGAPAPEVAPDAPAPEAEAPPAPEAPQASVRPVFQGLAFRS